MLVYAFLFVLLSNKIKNVITSPYGEIRDIKDCINHFVNLDN